MPSVFAEAASAARNWLLEAMLPLWSTAGFDDRAGQFVEALTLDGEPMDWPRRTLVQARQMLVCCAGARAGWSGPWRELTTAAGETLLARGRTHAGDWIYSFDVNGAPADARSDLYTQAFVILGLAEAGRALGRGDFISVAKETRRNLDTRWTDGGGGYLEGETAPHPGRQNPHMHLLEAALALHAATGDTDDLAWAEQLADLFTVRVLQTSNFAPEELDADWRPIEAAGVAPGHQFEWAWLLDRLRRAGGCDRSPAASAVWDFGEWRGIDRAGFAVDAIWPDGNPMTPTARLWPQAERLKAALVGFGGDGRSTAAAIQASTALFAYLDVPLPGTWRDLRLADGEWKEGPAPASSGYHIIGAFEALIEAASLDGGLA